MSEILAEIKMFQSLMGGRQRKFYDAMERDFTPVQVVPMNEVFPQEQVDAIIEAVRPQEKQCYKNAMLLSAWTGAEYCEGYMRKFGMNIEHAFNKVGDKFIDITAEVVLKDDVKSTEYGTLGVYDYDDAVKTCTKTGVYGGVYSVKFNEKIKSNAD